MSDTIVLIGGDSIYEIYIDMYFLFNFWMNLWVLFLCRFFLHSKILKRRICLAAFGASLGEVLVLCVPLGNSTLKILLGFGGITALTGYLLFRPESKRYFYKIMIYSNLSVMILGGIFLGLESITNGKKFPFFIWGMLVVVLVLWIERICQIIKVKQCFCKVILIFDENRQCEVLALIDSGNGLVEPISKIPVSVVEECLILNYMDTLKKENFRMIPFHSIGNKEGILEAYFIERMEIKKENEHVIVEKPMIAITKDCISTNKEYQMILHPKLVD